MNDVVQRGRESGIVRNKAVSIKFFPITIKWTTEGLLCSAESPQWAREGATPHQLGLARAHTKCVQLSAPRDHLGACVIGRLEEWAGKRTNPTNAVTVRCVL